jgi:hypothetical protein
MTSGFVVEFFGSGAAGETFANPEDGVAEDDESTLSASKNPHLAILGFTNLNSSPWVT